MNYSLHNHTYRCKHAIGSEKEMLEEGYKQGFQVFGISDHIAYPTKETKYRMEYEERIPYLENLKQLKNEYKDKINFYRGYEVEYQSDYDDYLKSLFINDQVDYLVLGQHYYNIHKPASYYGGLVSTKEIKNYVDHCIQAMKTGYFLFLAHPDLFLNNGLSFDENALVQSKRLIQAAIENDVYLEYNAGGIRNGIRDGIDATSVSYPRNDFWYLVAKSKAKVVVNPDAHSPEQITDVAYQKAKLNAMTLKLNVVNEIDFEKYEKRINNIIK
ncbi:PHP domain-containing protein [Mycoplasma sp. P36-A1]|uniref:PHP domain-containing protein n=1 Tax=Mycoplasma sp. P36-A1 TaxID=3252900 RepID=UPI003C307988